MSDTAIIRIDSNDKMGILLHSHGDSWNVDVFLRYCRLQGFEKKCDTLSTLLRVIGNLYPDCVSIITFKDKAEEKEKLSLCDRGEYIITPGFAIKEHIEEVKCFYGSTDDRPLLQIINSAQPKEERLPEKLIEHIEQYHISTNDTFKNKSIIFYQDNKYRWSMGLYLGKSNKDNSIDIVEAKSLETVSIILDMYRIFKIA
jgi:hypothetical protein